MMKRDEITKRIALLTAQLHELESNIPAHSTKPHHIQQIEDLEEEIVLLEEQLEQLN
jgi:chromosome segregation ATPase